MKILVGMILVLVLGTILIGLITSDNTVMGFGWKKFKDAENEFTVGLDQSSYTSMDGKYKMDQFVIGFYFCAITFLFTTEIRDNIAL